MWVHFSDVLPARVTPVCGGPWTRQWSFSPASLTKVGVTHHGLNFVPTKSWVEALTSNPLIGLFGGRVFTVKWGLRLGPNLIKLVS